MNDDSYVPFIEKAAVRFRSIATVLSNSAKIFDSIAETIDNQINKPEFRDVPERHSIFWGIIDVPMTLLKNAADQVNEHSITLKAKVESFFDNPPKEE